MDRDVLIQAINLHGNPIRGFKEVIKLYLNTANDDAQTLSCNEERENGIYVFKIHSSIDTTSRVFVQLSQDKTIKEQGDSKDTITYLRKPHFPHPTCMQINILECMIHNDMAVPYIFTPYGNTPIIAIIKAYKLPTQGEQSYSNIGSDTLDNTLQSYKYDWQNEIYTIDTTQTIRLQAFIGKSIVDKALQEDVRGLDVSQIKWGYMIVESRLQTTLNTYPKINKNVIPLKDKIGVNIAFNLNEITQQHPESRYKANSNTLDTSGNNIILFAYIVI